MGAYDVEIAKLTKEIEERKNQIESYKRDMEEMERLLEECNRITSRVSETTDTIFRDIDKIGTRIEGNFAAYYKSNVLQIFSRNKMSAVSDSTDEDKKKLKKHISFYENEITRLRTEINSMEEERARFTSRNT